MEHVSALSSSLRKRGGIIFRGPLLVARSFEGLTAEPTIEPPQRRHRAVTNSGETDSIPLETLNVDPEAAVEAVEASAPPTETETPPSSEPHLLIDLTVNRVCRLITIIILGRWAGWSFLPSESKIPISPMWVGYICLITDWVVFTTDLDCMWPSAMDWYFRKRPNWKFLVKENRQPYRIKAKVTGFRILNTVVGFGVALLKYIMQKDQPLLTSTDAIVGGPIFVILFWLGCLETEPDGPGAWFFHYDYGPHLLIFTTVMFALSSWWWIALRILAIVNIIRNRRKPEIIFQFRILTVGLAIEAFLLIWFFSIPLLHRFRFRWMHWDKTLWYSHLSPLFAMLLSWIGVVVIGLWADLPNIFFPCSGSTSKFCQALTRRAYAH